MLKSILITMLFIPILVFAFSFNESYSKGYLSLTFSDATSTISIYVDGSNLFSTSLNAVKFYVGKKVFELSLEYRGKFYRKKIGVSPYCNITKLSQSATSIVYDLSFDIDTPNFPNMRVYSDGLLISFSVERINNKDFLLYLPVPNGAKYFKFILEGYTVRYDGQITNIIDINPKDNHMDFYAYTDFHNDYYWISLVVKHAVYFNSQPKITIESSDVNIDVSKYFTNKDTYIFGTYRYKKDFFSSGKYELVIKLNDYVKKYDFFIYKSLAFFPDIHKQLSMKISGVYTVKPGDTLYYIAVNHNTDVESLIKINNFENGDNIIAGQKILLGKVLFSPSPDTIIVSEDNSRLYFFHNMKLISTFFCSPGVKGKTPIGVFQIIRKIKDPVLYWEGEVIPPLSPINGLGTRFLQLSDPQYGVHGTTKPWEIGRRVSHGCIRMMNFNVEELFNLVQVGTRVIIVKNVDNIHSESLLDKIFKSNNLK
jgi:hypothetical protein